mmetsp:Transcript_93727/g.151304  ORF Transcript_93727/g.151304 Transcript_93727/m.151304 type:complete len:268 (-) Transcript_93727:139-942(-)
MIGRCVASRLKVVGRPCRSIKRRVLRGRIKLDRRVDHGRVHVQIARRVAGIDIDSRVFKPRVPWVRLLRLCPVPCRLPTLYERLHSGLVPRTRTCREGNVGGGRAVLKVRDGQIIELGQLLALEVHAKLLGLRLEPLECRVNALLLLCSKMHLVQLRRRVLGRGLGHGLGHRPGHKLGRGVLGHHRGMLGHGLFGLRWRWRRLHALGRGWPVPLLDDTFFGRDLAGAVRLQSPHLAQHCLLTRLSRPLRMLLGRDGALGVPHPTSPL